MNIQCSKTEFSRETVEDNSKMAVEQQFTKAETSVPDFHVTREEADFLVSVYYPDVKIDSVREVKRNSTLTEYVYFFQNAWAAIAADKRVSPVIACNYNSAEIDLESEQWLQMLSKKIETLESDSLTGENDNYYEWVFILSPLYKDTMRINGMLSNTASICWG